MKEEFSRTVKMIGEEAVEKLQKSRVAVFGLGGVGGFAVEALVRAGVGSLTLCDSDTVSLSNLNRQIIALSTTVGRLKTDVIAERAKSINPDIELDLRPVFFGAETASAFNFADYDYIVDAIDSVSSKLLIAEMARDAGTPLISCMGAGNKLDPTRFRVADISKTSVCPLAKVMRRELRKRGINHLKVVYSEEPPVFATEAHDRTPGSISFVPGVAGLILAGEVIKDISGCRPEQV